MELGWRFLSGLFDEEFGFQESISSSIEGALDIVHRPSGLICLFDDSVGSVNLAEWFETEGPEDFLEEVGAPTIAAPAA